LAREIVEADINPGCGEERDPPRHDGFLSNENARSS
jgi:hypothetical protein